MLAEASEQVPAEIIRDFIEKNREQHAIWPEMTRRLSASLLSLDEAKKTFTGYANDGWKRFYAKYPKTCGIVTVSRVGMNRDKTLAFFYVGNQRGSINGLGGMHVLKREGDAWVEQPIRIGLHWVS